MQGVFWNIEDTKTFDDRLKISKIWGLQSSISKAKNLSPSTFGARRLVDSKTRTYDDRVRQKRTAGRRRKARSSGRSSRWGIGLKIHLSSPKPGRTTVASEGSAPRGGWAGSGRTGCQQICSPVRPGDRASLVPSKASKTRRL